MRNSRAFTIPELLIAISVIMLVAAITMPIASQAKQRVSISNSLSNLRQIGIAISIYRNQYDGDGRYGYWAHMGLPPYIQTLVRTGHLGQSQLVCTGLTIPTNPERDKERYQRASWTVDDLRHLELQGFYIEYWAPYTERYRDGAICVYDLHHPLDGFAGVPYSPMDSRRALGLRLDGSTIVRVRAGDPERRGWWHDD